MSRSRKQYLNLCIEWVVKNIFRITSTQPKKFLKVFIALLSMSLLSIVAETTSAQTNSDVPITIYTGKSSEQLVLENINRLKLKAGSSGKIRVIVGLKFEMKMPHSLSASQAAVQSAALSSVQQRVAARVFGSAAAQAEDRLEFIPFMLVFADAVELDKLVRDPDVTSIQEDTSDEPLLTQSTSLIHATDLWLKNARGAGQAIAIIDTGVDTTHPMFAGKLKAEACYSTNGGDFLSLCPGGVDSTTTPGSGRNCSAANPECNHGTHVAGIALGNAPPRYGVAPAAKLISIQVFRRHRTSGVIRSSQADQIKALQRIYQLAQVFPVAAVNMSLGSGAYPTYCDHSFPAMTQAMTLLASVGTAVVVASGNDSLTDRVRQPSCITTAVAVGNSSKVDNLFHSSNHSDIIDLLAPGANILSAMPGGTYGTKYGTSMAAPHVAGAFALLKAVKPAADVNQIVDTLVCTGKEVSFRLNAQGVRVKLADPKRRIDVLGAYNRMRAPIVASRSWQFATSGESNDWSALRGNWRVAGGGMRLTTPETNGWVGTSVANCDERFEVSARVQVVDRDLEFRSESGIIVRTADGADIRNGYVATFMDCSIFPEGCRINGISANGMAKLRTARLSPDGIDYGGELCNKTIPIAVGGYNIFRIFVAPTSITYYLNGRFVCTVESEPVLDIMLYGFIRNSGVLLNFDSISVTSRNPTPLITNESYLPLQLGGLD
jgi:subtilisin family serine protease